MAITELPLPLAGASKGLAVSKENMITSGYMLNVRPRDTLERRIRIGKRPGLKKSYSQQIGGAAYPIIELLSVTVVA